MHVTAQCVNKLARFHIPNLAGAINRARDALAPFPVELTARDFPPVPLEGVDTTAVHVWVILHVSTGPLCELVLHAFNPANARVPLMQ